MWATHQLTVSDWGGRPHSRAGSTRMHPTGGSEFRGAPPPALMGAALTSAGAAPRVQSRSPSVQMQQAWSADADTAAAPHIPRPVSVSPPSPRSPRSPPSPRSPQSPPAMRPPTSPVGGHSRPGSPEGTARQASSRPATSSSPTRGARGGGGMRSWVQSHLGVAGTLSYKEWTNPDKVFDLIDRDRSGQVSKSEVSRLPRPTGTSATPSVHVHRRCHRVPGRARVRLSCVYLHAPGTGTPPLTPDAAPSPDAVPPVHAGAVACSCAASLRAPPSTWRSRTSCSTCSTPMVRSRPSLESTRMT